MIFVECTFVDLKAGQLKGKMHKTFSDIGEFNSWYSLAKMDTGMVLNIMRYNPMEKPSLKQVYDVRLLQVSREFST